MDSRLGIFGDTDSRPPVFDFATYACLPRHVPRSKKDTRSWIRRVQDPWSLWILDPELFILSKDPGDPGSQHFHLLRDLEDPGSQHFDLSRDPEDPVSQPCYF